MVVLQTGPASCCPAQSVLPATLAWGEFRVSPSSWPFTFMALWKTTFCQALSGRPLHLLPWRAAFWGDSGPIPEQGNGWKWALPFRIGSVLEECNCLRKMVNPILNFVLFPFTFRLSSETLKGWGWWDTGSWCPGALYFSLCFRCHKLAIKATLSPERGFVEFFILLLFLSFMLKSDTQIWEGNRDQQTLSALVNPGVTVPSS